MLLVVPVSIFDRHIAADFISAVLTQGKCKKHRLLVVASPQASIYALRLSVEIGGLFESCDTHIFDENGPEGWPCGPNYYFSQAVKHLEEINNPFPWLWCELDSTPMRPRWLDIIEAEYVAAAMPCLGVKATCDRRSGKYVVQQNYVVGVAVYPPHFSQYFRDYMHFPPDTAFDLYLGAHLHELAAQSQTIQHCWRTKNYQDTGGGVFQGCHGSDYKSKPMNDPVNTETALLHGCDDGSLARLIAPKRPKPKELDTVPLFLAVPRCGTTYTRESMRQILRDRSNRLRKSWAVLQFGNNGGVEIEAYILGAEPAPKQSLSMLFKMNHPGLLFACATSVAFENRDAHKSVVDKIAQHSPKPLECFTFIRPPVERIESSSAYNQSEQISENWMTKYLYACFYPEEQCPAPTPIEAKFRALEGLIESEKLKVFRFPCFNEALSKISASKLPLHFGEISHRERLFNRRPAFHAAFDSEKIKSGNEVDLKLYQLTQPSEPLQK
jgi:hypothetical protein